MEICKKRDKDALVDLVDRSEQQSKIKYMNKLNLFLSFIWVNVANLMFRLKVAILFKSGLLTDDVISRLSHNPVM